MTDKLEIITKLRIAQVSSCSCLTKTPEASYHREDCLYRVLSEAIGAISAPVVERQPVEPRVVGYMPDSPEGEPLITQESHQYYVAELQASVERLTASCIEKDARIAEMDRIGSATIARLTTENERLKGGQGALSKAQSLLRTLALGRGISRLELDPYIADQSDVPEQPAPVSVVLPEREHVRSKTLPFRNPAIGDGYISGWNACLDKVKELNQSQPAHFTAVDMTTAAAQGFRDGQAVPDGYCLMPTRLTAENGAKALLLGEFKLEVTSECPECRDLEEPLEGCEVCDGEGEYGQQHMIPWDQIKYIYSEAVKGLAKKPNTPQ